MSGSLYHEPAMRSACLLFLSLSACQLAAPTTVAVREPSFLRQQLSDRFYAEGACAADLNRDGALDIVAGTCWWPGPNYVERRELRPEQSYDPLGYSEHFFAWPCDVDADGWIDIVRVGFPGKAAEWLRNPGEQAGHWEAFLVHPVVDNESPAFVDIDRDGMPELLCQTGAHFGYAKLNPKQPREPWRFHQLSAALDGLGPFTHGLGVGDIDGDGLLDVCWREGWFRQPADLSGDPVWPFQRVRFSEREGGAQMLITDVDGDGLSDIVTSLAAHHFGLSWFRQTREQGAIGFVEERVMTDQAEQSAGTVCFCELHALALADINGDGLQDVVTGKRWWSHGPDGDCQPGSKSVTYWFELVRDASGAHYVPRLADEEAGVGTAVTVEDIDRDQRPDILVANKRGVFVLWQRSIQELRDQPPARKIVSLDFERGELYGWTVEGEAFRDQPVRGDTVQARGREASRHQGQFWIGGYEKHGDKPTGRLISDPIPITQPWVSFLVGGGGNPETRVELRSVPGDELLFSTSGPNYESLQRVACELSDRLGQALRVVLVDEHTGHWGHINFDDLRFHGTKPELPRDADIPAILVLDQVAHTGIASAADAAKAMTVPDGFQVDLIAAEPQLHQPVALCVDNQGRLWVAQALTYPQRAPEGQGRDEIVVFEDRDGDGSYESRTVFLKGLNLVSGIEVGFGGVWIGAAPQLLFVPDVNADLEPDGDAVVKLDGWGYQDTHETLNSLRWGPDGWLYGCHGVFTHSLVGKPGTPDSERVPLNAGVWRFHPQRESFEVFAHGTSNPWGLDFDARGEALITACVIPHVFHVLQGGRYVRQAGSHFDAHAYLEIDTIADHRHWLGENPWAGNNRSGDAGGGHAHAGALIYQATQFPEEYRGALLMNNIHGNRINHDRLERQGSGLIARHAPDLVLANDRWFRGISLQQGPSGEVFFIDWYDQQACHLQDPTRFDRTNGRLYRLRYGDWRRPAVKVSALASRELVRRCADSNAFVARHARRMLQERGISAALVSELESTVRNRPAQGRLESLWVLHSTGKLSEALAQELFRDPDDSLAGWAVQCVLEDRSVESSTLLALEHAASVTTSPVLRRFLASALQRLPLEQRWKLAQTLLGRSEDAQDPNIPKLLWYAVEPLVALDTARSLELALQTSLPELRTSMVRRAAADPKLHAALFAFLAERSTERDWPWLLAALQQSLNEQRGLQAPAAWPQLAARLAAVPGFGEAQASIARAFGDTQSLPALRARVLDTTIAAEQRRVALGALVAAKDAELEALLPRLIEDSELELDAIRAWASYESSVQLLARYPSLSARARRESLRTLAARRSTAELLLQNIEQGKIPRADCDAIVAQTIFDQGDAALRARLAAVWGQARRSSAEAQVKLQQWIERLAPEVLAQANVPHGREVYSRTCQNCHSLFGKGGTLGPELTGSNRHQLEYLLSNILDPSALVGQDYRATLVWMNDGRFYNGLLRSETSSSLTLENERERITLDKAEIEQRQLAPNSLMPEGQLDTLSFEEVRDLLAYLQSPVQTPIRATKANVERLWDGRTLEGWKGDGVSWSVQNGVLIGKTAGLARNEFLISEYELGDFRLEVDVQLVDDAGNSGIQFRSQELPEREVMGYQADIGPGWWGKLYEEHRRGLLVSSFDASHFVPGAWHRYQIEARGARVRTWLDGQLCVDLEDPDGLKRGVLAFQLHSGPATELRVRNLRVEILD